MTLCKSTNNGNLHTKKKKKKKKKESRLCMYVHTYVHTGASKSAYLAWSLSRKNKSNNSCPSADVIEQKEVH